MLYSRNSETHHSSNLEVLELLSLLSGDPVGLLQLVQQTAPLLPEQVGSGQRAVASDDHQVRDLALDQIAGGGQATGALPEGHATRGSNHSAAVVNDTGDGRPVGLLNVVAAIDHSLVALPDEVDLNEWVDKQRGVSVTVRVGKMTVK